MTWTTMTRMVLDGASPLARTLAWALAAAGVWMGGSAFGGTWQPLGGIWDGDLSDPLRWSGGFSANGGENAISSLSAPGAMTVRVAAAAETTAKLRLDAAAAHPLVLDATGGSLLFATQAVAGAAWPASALHVRLDGTDFLTGNANDARWNRQAQARLADVAVTAWSPAPDVAELRVAGAAAGVFNFVDADPRGTTMAPNGARPTVSLFNPAAFAPGQAGRYTHGRLAFANVKASLPSLNVSPHPEVAEIAVSGGSLDLHGNVALASPATNRFTLTDGATLRAGNPWTMAGDGATLLFKMDADARATVPGFTLAGHRRVVLDGGTFSPTGVVLFTGSDAAVFTARKATVERGAEARIALSGQARFLAEEAVLRNAEKFTVKTDDDARVEVKGGALTTPLMAGAERSRIDLEGVDVAVGNWGLSNSRVRMAACTFSPDAGFAVSGADGAYLLTNVTGATSLSGHFALAGSNVVTFTADGLGRTLVVNGGGDHGKIGSGPYGELNLEGGTFAFRAPKASQRLNLGHGAPGNVGVLNVRGGRLVSKTTQDGATRSFGLGITHGTGFITVSGGELDVSGLCICTEDSGNARESVFRQTGGLVKVAAGAYQPTCQSVGLCATGNGKTTRRARIALDGGVTEASVVAGGTSGRCRGGTGWTAFEANGGTVRANAADAQILRDFDEATLGEKGLTVDGDGYDLAIAQNLAGAPGATGRLTLTGAGTKTISGTNAVEIVVQGGAAVFAAGADNARVALVATNGATLAFAAGGARNRTFKSLMLGDDARPARLSLTAGEPLAVTGDVVVRRLALVLSGAFTTGESYVLLTCGGSIDEASLDAWRQALARGLGEDQGCDFLSEEDGAGRRVLKMAVRKRKRLVLAVDPHATSNVAASLAYDAADILTADVGMVGTLRVTGPVGRGALVKTGLGRATFDHAADFFAGGVSVQAGLLAFPDASIFADAALGDTTLALGAGTLALGRAGAAPAALVPSFVLQAASEADAAVVQCASDVALAAPSAAHGCLVKRGPGALTLEAAGTCSLSPHAGADVKDTPPAAAPIVFDPFGQPPSVGYSSLTVAEGDLVLRGAARARYEMAGRGAVYVGMPVPDIARPARLVVDGVAAAFGGSHFHVGSGVRASNCAHPDAAFVVTNGAVVEVTSLRIGWNGGGEGAPRVRVAGAGTRLYVKEYLYVADSVVPRQSEADALVSVTDGARLWLPSLSDGNPNHALCLSSGGTVLAFDGGGLAAKDHTPGRVRVYAADGRLVFRNKSVCCVSEIRVERDDADATLVFDGSEWTFGASGALALERPERLTVRAENAGLVLAPATGTTMTFPLAVTGPGDLVKRGAGALVLSAAPTLTGVCRVEEGALALDAGVVASDLTLTGAGALTGGTFARTTLLAPLGDAGAVTGAVPVLAGATLTGRTRIDLARTTPLEHPLPQNVRVATYVGAVPDVSQWTVVNSATPRVVATFSAANGEVRMALKATGFVLLFR